MTEFLFELRATFQEFLELLFTSTPLLVAQQKARNSTEISKFSIKSRIYSRTFMAYAVEWVSICFLLLIRFAYLLRSSNSYLTILPFITSSDI